MPGEFPALLDPIPAEQVFVYGTDQSVVISVD